MTAKIQAFKDDLGRIRLLLSLPEGEPPKELILLQQGITETSKGNILFDGLAADMTMTRYQEHGQKELPFDYDHGMMSFITTPESSKAAGWFTPKVRDGALVAADIGWTPTATKVLQDKEYRHFSPAVWLDEQDNRVTRLINVALTNLPATKNQEPIMAHDVGAVRPPEAEKERETMDEILKLLGVKTEAEAIAKLSRNASAVALLLSEAGKSSTEDAFEQIRSWKKEASSVLELANKVRNLETEKAENEREQLITRLNEEGKLPESLFGWARTQSLDSLRTFGKDAPVSSKLKSYDPLNGESAAALTDAELQTCKLLGMTRAKYLEAKKQKAEDDERMRAEREGRVL